jgi:hypothetical protein
MRSALFCNITQCWVIVPYRRFGKIYRFHLKGSRLFSWTFWPLKIGPIGCPETSVQNYRSTPRNNPEERGSHLHRGGSLKSRNVQNVRNSSSTPQCTFTFWFTVKHIDNFAFQRSSLITRMQFETLVLGIFTGDKYIQAILCCWYSV